MTSNYVIKLFFSICALALIMLRVIYPNLLPTDTVTLGLLIVAILPWFSFFINSAEFPGGWKFQFRELENEQKKQKSQIESLRFLVCYFVTEDELIHLKKLARKEEFSYERNERFISELRRLRDLGLIRRTSEITIGSLPINGCLKNFLEITESGYEYLRIRQELEIKQSEIR